MKRAVLYVRVSSKEQAEEGYSMAAQREACLKFIADEGWQPADEFSDRGESARTADRPQFQAMLSRLDEDRTISYLVVHKLDRLARNLEDHAAVRAMLRKYGVKLVSVTESLEETASGKLVEGILASIAEFYSANLAQEIKKGLLQKVKEGGWPTTAPIGYKNIRKDGDVRRGEALIIPDPDQAPLVRQAFELYATGDWSLKELHAEMARRGLRSRFGTPLAVSKVALMLKNPAYLGKVPFNGVEYEGKHKPLISAELFRKVEEVFKLHDYAGERKRKHTHYLRGTLFCGVCGARVSSMVKKGGRFEYFFCLGSHSKRTGCRELYAPTLTIEQQVEELYREIRMPEKVRKEVERGLQLEVAEREKDRGNSAELAGKRLTKLAAERDKLLRAYYADAIPLETLKKEQSRIDSETAVAEHELDFSKTKVEAAKELIQTCLRLLGNCHRSYKRADASDRRKWNQAIFKAIYIQDRKVAAIEYKEPFAAIQAQAKGSISDHHVDRRGHYSNLVRLLKGLV